MTVKEQMVSDIFKFLRISTVEECEKETIRVKVAFVSNEVNS